MGKISYLLTKIGHRCSLWSPHVWATLVRALVRDADLGTLALELTLGSVNLVVGAQRTNVWGFGTS